MTNRGSRIAGLTIAALIVASIGLAATGVQFVGTEVRDGQIYASIQVDGLVDDEAEQRLLSGREFQTEIRFYLMRKRANWMDAQIAVNTLQFTAIYHAVTQEYILNRRISGEVESHTVHSLDELRNLIERPSDIPVFVVPETRPGRRFFMRSRAFLGYDYLFGAIPKERWTPKTSSRPFSLP